MVNSFEIHSFRHRTPAAIEQATQGDIVVLARMEDDTYRALVVQNKQFELPFSKRVWQSIKATMEKEIPVTDWQVCDVDWSWKWVLTDAREVLGEHIQTGRMTSATQMHQSVLGHTADRGQMPLAA